MTPIDPSKFDAFIKEMETKVIPETIEVLHEREKQKIHNFMKYGAII